MMKRALAAALLSGLIVFAAPQVVFADHAADPARECGAGSEKSADYSEEQPPARSERSAPGPRYGDREQHDEDEFLF
jgi:hypothetical protein